MHVVRELRIEAVGVINETFSFGPVRPRFLDAHIFANTTDAISITSFGLGGGSAQHCQLRPIVGAGNLTSFGGPIFGDAVAINWSGTLDFKRGLFRFWDEYRPPFGFAEIGQSSESGIAPAADSTQVDYALIGDWFNAFQIAAIGDQPNTLSLANDAGIGTPALQSLGLQAANGTFVFTQAPGLASSLGLRSNNGGAGNMSWQTRAWALAA